MHRFYIEGREEGTLKKQHILAREGRGGKDPKDQV